ncbi:hypothetical protein [Nitrosomonas sp.]|uniref:hypothetical protein n=1 Tax=Nitrosomonas sp. TaxID=42353 RepID=UPI00374C95BD
MAEKQEREGIQGFLLKFLKSTQVKLALAFFITVLILKYGEHLKKDDIEWTEWIEIFEKTIILLFASIAVHLLNQKFFADELEAKFTKVVSTLVTNSTSILNSTNKFGIKDIHPSRIKIHDAIVDLAKNASSRIWVSGASLSQDINLTDLIPILRDKLENSCDIKILLQNPICNSALYRSLLEADPKDIDNITRLSEITDTHPYFQTPLYHRFSYVFNQINGARRNELLKRKVRYYDQLPSHWLVIIDDIAYYQPYVLENRKNLKQDQCAYTPMPILEFDKLSNEIMFANLEDHFLTLFNTSNVDVYFMQVLIATRKNLFAKLAKEKNDRSWLRQLRHTLKNKQPDRRIETIRQKCMLPNSSVIMKWKNGESKVQKIINFSATGIYLRLETEGVKKGDIVTLKFDKNQCTEEEIALIDILANTHGEHFTVIRFADFSNKFLALERSNVGSVI